MTPKPLFDKTPNNQNFLCSSSDAYDDIDIFVDDDEGHQRVDENDQEEEDLLTWVTI